MVLLQECWKDLFLVHLCQWAAAWPDISPLLTARLPALPPGSDPQVTHNTASRALLYRPAAPDSAGDPGAVQRVAARPHRVRLYEDHRPVPAGGGRPGGAALSGAAAGPGAVHSGGLRSQQISQSADTVGMCRTALNCTVDGRFGRLLLVIPLLRMVRPDLVETLFFRETVGETNIKNIILDLYKCDKLPSV